jgi:predicted secreted protein
MARSGRSLLIKLNGTAIAGFQTNTVAFTAEGVEITDKLDDGFATYADFAGKISFEASGDGVAKDATLRDIFKNGSGGSGFLLSDVTIEWDDGEEWECDLFFSSYEETGAHDGAVEFSATFLSSGAWAEVTSGGGGGGGGGGGS